MTRNLIFPKKLENSGIDAHHTSKWAKSARNLLIWLKMKSERSSQKQHFFSHFEQFQQKMCCKTSISVFFVVKTLQTCLNSQFLTLFLFLHWISKFKTIFHILQHIFCWNCSKCEKKCCFCEERSDSILSQISEFLAEFAHFQVWCASIPEFLSFFGKMRFRVLWRSNMLHSPKIGQKFSWAKIASGENRVPKMLKILIFQKFSKVAIFNFIILQNEQNRTETSSCGSFWNPSSDWDFSDFSKIKKIWAICAWIWPAHGKCEKNSKVFFVPKYSIWGP